MHRTAWDLAFFEQFQIPLITFVSQLAVSSEPQIPDPDKPLTTVFEYGVVDTVVVVTVTVVVEATTTSSAAA